MMLQVRVPVLSEKMYSTWPSSSLRFDDCTFVPSALNGGYPIHATSAGHIQLRNCTMSDDSGLGVTVLNNCTHSFTMIIHTYISWFCIFYR
jgi:hypothetical protein